MKRKEKRYLVVDLETTGNQANRHDRIIQFAATLVEGSKRLETYSTFINPEREIPPFIQQLTGIKPSDCYDAPIFTDVAPIIQNLLEDCIFVAHNVSFDWTFLAREMQRAGYPLPKTKKLDTVELARIIYPGIDSYKLQDLSDEFKLGHDRPHQADSDAEVTADLLLLLLDKLENLPLPVIRKMATISQSLKNYLPELLFELEMQKDRELKALPDELMEYRGLVIRKKPTISEPAKSSSYVFPKTAQAKAALFEQNGLSLTKRTGQFEMMDVIQQAIEQKRHALIEAGTGIGKSLGYFIPAVYHAKQSGMPVVISTYTTLLQNQLVEKDIPLLEKIVGFPVAVSLLKGRDHYLNLFKFEQLLEENESQYDVVVTKLKLLVWLTETTTGDISEVNLSSGGELFWNRMKHTGWYLSAQHDPWLDYDFYRYNYEQSRHADLLIVNHALLLADHFGKQAILPDYEVAVIDEAHHFADSARDRGTFILSYRKIKYFLNQLGSLEKYSLLAKMAMLFPQAEMLYDLDVAAFKLGEASEELFVVLQDYAKQTKLYQLERGLISNSETEPLPDDIFYAAEKVYKLLREAALQMDALLAKAKAEETNWDEAESAFLEEIYAFLLDWQEMTDDLAQMIYQKVPVQALSLESDSKRSITSMRIKSVRLDNSEQLKQTFFDQKKTVILTSATLTITGDFRFICQNLGLEESELITRQIESPFDYENQARVLIPTDMPPIKDTPVDMYTLQLARYLAKIAKRTDGRMLVLFTSFEMLQKTYYHLKSSHDLETFRILAQGVSPGSVTRLAKQFQVFQKSILLGTSSFWEGIDIPGKALSCLAIVRLPFVPLDDPYAKAQISLRKERGENAFQTYSLPEAILRFKQGFGRLIRRETDRGIVFVFDSRLETTKFGKAFLTSIPQTPVITTDEEEILTITESFFKDS